MAEPTCVLRAFSYTPGISNEAKEDKPMYALEESVSLGRFMSESLSWEKWSTFSRNRYVEEAEKYSKPGSVKQKKAYFEAHFKRMAALKAAALLEQANTAQGGALNEPNTEANVHNDGSKVNDHAYLHDQQLLLSSPPSVDDQQGVEKEASDSGLPNEHNLNDGEDQVVSETDQEGPPYELNSKVEVHNNACNINDHVDLYGQEELVLTSPASINNQQLVKKGDDNLDVLAHNEHNQNDGEDHVSAKIIQEAYQATQGESTEHPMDVENHNPSTEMESSLPKTEESCLEDHVRTKIIEEADQATQRESTEHLKDVEKHNPCTKMESSLAKTQDSCLEHPSISQDTFAAASLKGKRNPPLSAYIPSSPGSRRNPSLSSYMPSIEAATSPASSTFPKKSLAKPLAVHPGKENTCTPVGRKSWVDDPDKKRTPLRMSINRELNRLISPVMKKIGSSSKASNKDCSSPLKTPAKAPADGMTNAAPDTSPQSGRRRARALFDSLGRGSKAARPRWQFLSEIGAKSPAVGRKKATSPVVPKSFCLSGDRVPTRKEKLEEKFNAKATENLQQRSNLKEKPKELAKLRQSFCFGAKLSSDSFREQEGRKVASEKSKVTHEQLPKKGSRFQNMTFLPPRRPGLEGTKNVQQKKGEMKPKSLAS